MCTYISNLTVHSAQWIMPTMKNLVQINNLEIDMDQQVAREEEAENFQ